MALLATRASRKRARTIPAPTAMTIPFPPNTEFAKVLQIGGQVIETFACDATPAAIEVGDGSDADAYGKLTIADGQAAATVSANPGDSYPRASKTEDSITALTVTFTNGTDAGVEAGQVTRGWIDIAFWNEDRELDIY